MGLTMVISNGLFIIGGMMGGNKLNFPRVFQLAPELDENGKPKLVNGIPKMLINMSPLPGIPPYVRIGIDAVSYPIPEREKAIYDLYARVTDRAVDPNWKENPE